MSSVFRFYIIVFFSSTIAYGQDACTRLKEKLSSGDILNIGTLPEEATDCPDLVGQAYLRKGDTRKAEKAFRKAYEQSAPGSPQRASALNDLGIVFWNMGSTQKAVEYITNAVAIRKNHFGENSESVAASYNDLGLVISAIDPDQALDYYESAYEIYKELHGKKDEKSIRAQINTAIAYRNLELYGDATNLLDEALKNWKEGHTASHPTEAFILNNIGRVQQLTNDLNGALEYYQKALLIYISFYGKKHPEVANTHNLIGNIYNQQGEFDMALSYYQQALIANSNQFENDDIEANPLLDDYLNANTFLNSLYYKSKAFADLHFNKTLKFSDLKMSLATLQACDTLIDEMRKIRTNESDKLALGEIAGTIYETGVELCRMMGDVAVKKDAYYELSFYFAEKSKSAVLLEAIADAQAKSFAGLDDDDLAREMKLKTDLNLYETLLSNEKDKEARNAYRQQWLELKDDYNGFIKSLEKKYPKYFKLKYDVGLPSISEIQKKLRDDQTVLSYFLTETSRRIYMYEISKEKFKLHNTPQGELFDHYLSGFRNGIYFQVKEVYLETAKALYDMLLPRKFQNKNTTGLILIPAGRLTTTPFEALLTDKTKPEDAYSSLPYLNKELSISYVYSGALLPDQTRQMPDNALLCAPVSFAELPSLPGSEEEINSLKNILDNKGFGTTVKLKSQANEKQVKELSKNRYAYIHLATHGVVNEINPGLSRVYLNSEGEEDGNLFTGEIYNLSLNTNLVTLSACETGLGKLTKGEGVIGLTRALLYAGADNLVVSLWRVSDSSTSNLMTSFYSNITDREFSKPLQQAKRNLIETEQYAAPYYWAPFILIGQ